MKFPFLLKQHIQNQLFDIIKNLQDELAGIH